MEKDNFLSLFKNVLSDMKSQFFISFVLLLIYISSIFSSKNTSVLLNYIYRIFPKFLRNVLYVSYDELRSIIFLFSVCMITSLVFIIILGFLYEQDKIKINIFNTHSLIKTLEKLFMGCMNAIVYLFLLNLINGMSFTQLATYFNIIHLFIPLVYLGYLFSFFSDKD